MSNREASVEGRNAQTVGAIRFAIKEWEAWAPAIEDKSSWQSWAQTDSNISFVGEPSVKFLPPMFRRRLSCLSKMALTVAYRCMGERKNIPVVFCSRRGEDETTYGLLQSIINKEPVSPTGFSLAVHNAASGLYTIDRGEKAPVTALAAGVDSFCAGLMDAIASLASAPTGEVLYVYYDEPLLKAYEQYQDNDNVKIALALLLSDRNPEYGISFSGDKTVSMREAQVISFLKFFLNQQPQVSFNSPRLCWQLARIK